MQRFVIYLFRVHCKSDASSQHYVNKLILTKSYSSLMMHARCFQRPLRKAFLLHHPVDRMVEICTRRQAVLLFHRWLMLFWVKCKVSYFTVMFPDALCIGFLYDYGFTVMILWYVVFRIDS